MEIKVKAKKNLNKDQERTFTEILVLLRSVDLGGLVNEAKLENIEPNNERRAWVNIIVTCRRSKDLNALWDAVQV